MMGFEEWLQKQTQASVQKMFANISPSGTRRGAVIASPSRHDPDYFYHWIRDAGLVMDVVVQMYEGARGGDKSRLFKYLDDYVEFSYENQATQTLTGLGEPKFYADGRAYNEPWGRPQNDSPALRALTLIRFAKVLLREGNQRYVESKLYRANADSVIKADLEYVAKVWHDRSFDLWEEVRGYHFYTRMVQQAALIEGAELAKMMSDPHAHDWYLKQAKGLEGALADHWDAQKGRIMATLGVDEGIRYKDSGLDTAVLLGVLHTNRANGSFSYLDDRVLATAAQLEQSFQQIYQINQNGVEGVAIGRYPEDRYFGGNPWILTTAAFAEIHFRVAQTMRKKGGVKINKHNIAFFRSVLPGTSAKNLQEGMAIARTSPMYVELVRGVKEKGDVFLKRIHFHANPDLSMAEQLRRDNGFQTSAHDLTWSYASFLTAMKWRP